MSFEQKPRQLEKAFPAALKLFIVLYVVSWIMIVAGGVTFSFDFGTGLAVDVLGILIYLGAMVYAKFNGGVGTWGGWLLYTIIPFAAVVLILRWASKGKTEMQ